MLGAFKPDSKCKFLEGFQGHEALMYMFVGVTREGRWRKFVEHYTGLKSKREG